MWTRPLLTAAELLSDAPLRGAERSDTIGCRWSGPGCGAGAPRDVLRRDPRVGWDVSNQRIFGSTSGSRPLGQADIHSAASSGRCFSVLDVSKFDKF